MKNKLLFSVFVYFIILTLLSLGFWQIYRLNWKLELIERIENSLKNDPVFTLNREDILKFTGRNFSEYVIYLNGDYKIPKPRVITAKISNNHKKYAITWFSMAISILLIYLYFRKKNY